MRSREWLLALLACAAPVARASGAFDLGPPQADRPWQPRIGASGKIVPGAKSATAASASSYVLPPAPSASPPGALAAERSYTLPELIDLAESAQPDTRIAWLGARQAALDAGIAESTYLPHLSASVIGGHRLSHGDRSALDTSADTSSDATGGVAALSLEWLLFDFGVRKAVLEQAREATVAANIGFTAAHQRVIHDVCIAYYALGAARGHAASAEQALRHAQAIETAAIERRRRGIGTVVETTHAAQATAQAQLALVQARGRAEDARLALLTAMGVSPLSRFELADTAPRELPESLAQPVEQLVTHALAQRPDVLAAYSAERASAAGVRAAEADFRPKVFLSASTSYGTGHLGVNAVPPVAQQAGTFNLSGNQWNTTVLVGVTVPLYDAGLRSFRLQRARAEAEKAEALSERTRQQAVRQIVAAQNAVQTSLAAHAAASTLHIAAQTDYDAALTSYRQGIGTVTAVSAAAIQLLLADDASTDARNEVLSAAVTLAFATGTLGSAPAH